VVNDMIRGNGRRPRKPVCLLALLPSRVSLLFGNPDFWMRLA